MLYVIPEAQKSKQNKLIHCFEDRQLWPLVVTVLRTGCILARGHPLHGSVKITGNAIALLALRKPVFSL
jgi:hypothetical protein